MTTSAEQIRTFKGPAILSYGFRPFFLFGALWAALAIALWLPVLSERLILSSAFSPIEWHVHELVYGYVPAVVAGFLLTAVPNWTGRLPVVGTPLLMLFLTWVAGRIAIFISAHIGAELAAVIDLLFLTALGLLIAREIVAGGNTRNLKVLAAVGVLLVGNALFHLEAVANVGNGHGTRLGIAATVILISLVGGRIIPSFTRNWLARRGPGRLPAPFDGIDVAVMALTGLALASWVIVPDRTPTALLALCAAGLNVLRLGRWAGERTAAEPLVLILHIAYAFVPLGFLLLALGILAPGIVAPTGALHGWTVGAIGTMTLAVMTRASLGHTGQALTASASVQFIYLAVIAAAAARLLSAVDIWRDPLLMISATAWVMAFGGFAVTFGPLLAKPRTPG